MTQNLRFSVLIPAYNATPFIEKALDSVRNQSFTSYEVLITNDGSVDTTEQIITEYLNRYKDFPATLYNQENKGIGGATNLILQKAQGQYIALLDADDFWYSNKLENVDRFLNENYAVDIICHNVLEVRENGSKRVLKCRKIGEPYFEDLLINGNGLFRSATVIRSVLAQKLGGLSEDPDFNGADDYEFWLRLANEGAQFSALHEVLGEYRRVTGSLTSKIEEHCEKCLNTRLYHMSCAAQEGRYSPDKVIRMKNRIHREYLYSLARDFFYAGKMKESVRYYGDAIRHSPLWWKPYAGIIDLLFKMPSFVIKSSKKHYGSSEKH